MSLLMFKKVVGSNPLKAIATRALSVQKTLASVAKISIPNQVNDWLNEDAQTFAKLQRVAKETSLRLLMDAFDNRKKLPKEIVLSILDASIITHKLLPNVLHIDRPRKSEDAVSRKNPFTGIITVVGDTHGQYDDFVQIFQNNKIGGFPSEQNQFVFNGDIVDRGPNAVEILMTLLFAKLQCPTSVHILRGNHESRYGTKHYGFLKEVLKKYDEAVFDKFLEFFDTLPICAVIENNTFVTHGGLGVLSHKSTVAEINQEDRFKEIIRGMLDELTWADPSDESGCSEGIRPGFGPDITRHFLKKNKLKLLIRSHQVREDGYDIMHNGKCITVFSAPNYCGRGGNKGAVVRFDKPVSMKPKFAQFSAVPPKVLKFDSNW